MTTITIEKLFNLYLKMTVRYISDSHSSEYFTQGYAQTLIYLVLKCDICGTHFLRSVAPHSARKRLIDATGVHRLSCCFNSIHYSAIFNEALVAL
jgi:hypothetical protein